MKRQEFLDFFNEHFENKGDYYYFSIQVEEVDDKIAIRNAINKHFMPFLEKIEINDVNFTDNLNIHPKFDWDYAEEDPEGEFCQYHCHVNLHRIYDNYVLQADFPLKIATIYRIETIQGESLYNTGYAATKHMNNNQPDPMDDPLLKNIFDDKIYPKDSDYKKQWYFAFSNLEDAHKWMGNNLEQCMQDYELQIKRITVPRYFAIEGNGQTIFQKSQIIQELVIALDCVENKKVAKILL